jgi:hypothetical protein
MPLPAPQSRTHLHTRSVVYRGYHREDGLWDIEAEMTDVKTHTLERSERGLMPPGTPVHDLAIRVTLDDSMTIRAISSAMNHTPFGECQQGNDPMQKMVGTTMGSGWQYTIDRAIGGAKVAPICARCFSTWPQRPIRPFPRIVSACAGRQGCPPHRAPSHRFTWANALAGLSTDPWCSATTRSLLAGNRSSASARLRRVNLLCK